MIESVARTAAWLRECHDWLLANGLDGGCPMTVQAEPVAWRYTRADGHFFLTPKRCRDGYPEADGWSEEALYTGPTPHEGGSDAE